METISDQELMLRFQAGDRRAFETLVNRHQVALLNFFRRMGVNHEAEDLTQEVFVRLFRCRERYVPMAAFRTFLYAVARNVWADHGRKALRRQRLHQALGEAGDDAHDRSVAHGPARLEAEEALALLPEKMREVLVLSVYQGMRYEEIAATLGVPVGTVKSRVYLALRRLRKLYENGS